MTDDPIRSPAELVAVATAAIERLSARHLDFYASLMQELLDALAARDPHPEAQVAIANAVAALRAVARGEPIKDWACEQHASHLEFCAARDPRLFTNNERAQILNDLQREAAHCESANSYGRDVLAPLMRNAAEMLEGDPRLAPQEHERRAFEGGFATAITVKGQRVAQRSDGSYWWGQKHADRLAEGWAEYIEAAPPARLPEEQR